jgi:hypothetical protein
MEDGCRTTLCFFGDGCSASCFVNKENRASGDTGRQEFSRARKMGVYNSIPPFEKIT